VKNSEVRAQRDNDLIYHQDVPSPASLSNLQETKLVSATVPKGLLNSNSVIGNRHRLFSELAGWGSREAISQCFFFLLEPSFIESLWIDIYNDRKRNLLQEKIIDVAQELQDRADECVNPLLAGPVPHCVP